MKKEKFIQLVCDEINTIKEKATEEELAGLDYITFNHANLHECIYGQLTGASDTLRAKQIWKKQVEDVSNSLSFYFNNTNCKFKDLDFTEGNCFTHLEQYLYICNKKTQKQIIQYLKGEILELYLN